MASSTGVGGVEKNVAIVYTVEGVDQATADQERLAGALGETSEALGEATVATERAEQATASMGDVATEAGQRMLISQQQISAFASGLGQLSAIIGTDSEAGALMGRMSHFASTGIQIGSIFGPAGAVVGGITGALIPALDSLIASFDGADEAARIANERFGDTTRALNESARAARQAADDLERWDRAAAARQRRAAATERHGRIEGGEVTTAADARALAEALREQGPTSGIFGISQAELDRAIEGYEQLANEIERGAGALSGTPRRGGGRRRPAQSNSLDALMRGRGGDDAISFAAGLGGESEPTAGEIEAARGRGRARTGGAFDAQRGAEQRAQRAAIEELDRMQKDKHDRQMERIQEEADAWGAAGQKIGSTLYNAFQIAATGQESLDVAVVKSFKALGIQFGGQMVSEGIGALLTAIGNATNPATAAIAAAKAAEGAGKLALGIGLGAAGAAIPVPAAGGGAQSSTPRLGPQGSGETGGARSVVVNMNAPSVVTGTRAVVGREIGRALDDASLRFGRRMSA